MNNTKFDIAYAAGRFDLALNLLDGNTPMHKLTGMLNNYSIYKMLNEEEQRRVADAAVSCLSAPGTKRDECVHIMTDGELCTYLLTMTLATGDNAYDVSLININRTEARISELNRRLVTVRSCISLTGEAVFTYYPDTNRFHLYYISGGQNITRFDMDFDEWRTRLTEQSRIAPKDTESFLNVCAMIKNGENGHDCVFHGCIITDANKLERYRLNFMPEKNDDAVRAVIGTWAVTYENTGDVVSDAFDDIYIDSLTGLLNKKAIIKYAQDALKGANKNHVAFAMMDVDNFKSINDNFGHMFGDKVIHAVGDVIANAIGTDAIAGRMGGDEFFIVFEKFTEEPEFRNVLRSIKSNISLVFHKKLGEHPLTCSIGLARYGIGPNSTTYHDLFKLADRSLYLAKVKGKNRYIIYKPELHGDFNLQNDDDMLSISSTFYSETDINAFHHMLKDIIVYGMEDFTGLLDFMARMLSFDRISVFLNGNSVPAYTNTLGPEVCMADASVLKNLKFVNLFTNDLLTISNIHALEFSVPEVFRLLSATGVTCMMQYTLRDREGEIAGLVSADVFGLYSAFPQLAISLFSEMCRVINAVLIRENLI